ncbi:MAG: GDP-mannose 4,6-dehydratase [Sedimentisphaerales bacterium]|nr:GDP-mannose 4,6-dehydratase [Sedimentisphaerales bacterium]
MRVLVTGGAGFIGSHLCESLLKDGNRVDVIDDLSTGNTENIKACLNNGNFQFICDSILNENMVYTLVDKCDIIYHLAGAVGVQLIVDEPVRTIETNIRGTEVVLKVAQKFRKKVLITSTSEVYGKSENETFREDQDCVLGATTYSRWSYACSKAIDEFLGLAYHRQYNLPVILARLFNTVGERQTGQYGMVIPRFVQAALSGKPLRVYGTGKQTRCFAYVGDVIGGLRALADDAAAYGDVYNIGATEEVTIENLALMIKEMTASDSQVVLVPYEQAYGKPFDDMMRRVPDLEKINKKIGYKPKTTLRETLQIIINYFKKLENGS